MCAYAAVCVCIGTRFFHSRTLVQRVWESFFLAFLLAQAILFSPPQNHAILPFSVHKTRYKLSKQIGPPTAKRFPVYSISKISSAGRKRRKPPRTRAGAVLQDSHTFIHIYIHTAQIHTHNSQHSQ